MNKRICAALSALLCVVMFALPAFAVAETQPLTPDGNLEIVDDILHEDKQFITVKSRSGAEFYIVIDRSRDSDNVYFLTSLRYLKKIQPRAVYARRNVLVARSIRIVLSAGWT